MSEDKVQFEVVTPVKLLSSEQVDMVVVPGAGGDFGVLPGHSPLISSVRPGTVEVYQGNKITDEIFVEGGFAEVTTERCTLLAQEAQPVRMITEAQAEDRLKKARDRLEAADSYEHRKAAGRELDAADAMMRAVKVFKERQKARH